MSTKPKKKIVKSKKIKKAPLKLVYTDEEKVELKNKYDDILFHLSNFLSDHSVYEAVPENVKILVFSSELSLYEMIKVFIFEDIYCGLIYNPSLNNYLGLLTTRDLMLLYKYIINNFPNEPIDNFEEYLKKIFSDNENKNIDNNNEKRNEKNINDNINIFNYLKNINYIDYLLYVKNKELQNINIFSVSLDDNLYETLKKINIKNIHRLLVEDDNKNEKLEQQKLKDIEKVPEIKLERKEKYNKKVMSNAEKTTTANDSDEDYRNNNKLDMKKILETNKEDIITEKSENTLTKDDINKENSRITIEVNKEKSDVQNNDKEINENLNINEIEKKKEEEKPKKKKVTIKKKKITKNNSERSIGGKEITSPSIVSENEKSSKTLTTEGRTEKKIVKKIVKKKIIKKKNDLKLELPEEVTDKKNENVEKVHIKMNTNITEINNKEGTNIDQNKRTITDGNENNDNTVVKITKKVKKKIIKKKIPQKSILKNKDKEENAINKEKQESIEATQENKNNNNNEIKTELNNNNNENIELKQPEKKDNNEDKYTKKIEKEKDENNIKKINDIINTKKEEKQDSLKSLKNIRFGDKMKNYIGIVTNETIYEYLVFNYYSKDMKEFNLSLNELLILGNIPFLEKLSNGKNTNEKVYNTFIYYLEENYDIIPIFSEKEIEGFIYPKDFFFYIYNCESNQNLTNKEFLEKLYKDIDEEKPYGKNRVEYLELNETNKSLYVKELIEGLNCSIEKKIIIYDPEDKNKLFLISLKTIFKAIVEYNLNK